MGLFSRSRDKLQSRSLRARYDKHPDPETLGRLIQCSIRLGDLSEAVRLATQGVKKFDSEWLRELKRLAVRERAKRGLKEAQAELKRETSARAYLKLARDALQLRDPHTALEALDACIAEFPTCVQAYTLLAQVYEHRFVRDLVPEDGRRVLDYLQTACSSDPDDPDLRLRLHSFLELIGLSPSEDPLLEDDAAIDEALSRIEDQSRLPGDDVGERRRAQRELARLRDGLADIEDEIGLCRPLVLGPDGEAFNRAGAIENDPLVDFATDVSRASRVTVRRIGLGPLRGLTLETGGGCFVLRQGARSSVGCLLPQGIPIRGSQETLRKMMARTLDEGSSE